MGCAVSYTRQNRLASSAPGATKRILKYIGSARNSLLSLKHKAGDVRQGLPKQPSPKTLTP